jgi:hypothetical protein
LRQAERDVVGADGDRLRRFRRHLVGLSRYLRGNAPWLFDYGRAWRAGQRISTALAESTMNHLVNARMGKRQPMRWSADGAHLLLQVRCALLDDRLDDLFREWYPGWGASPATTAHRHTGLPPQLRNTSSIGAAVWSMSIVVTLLGEPVVPAGWAGVPAI